MAKKIKDKEVKWKSFSHVRLFVTHGLYSPWNSAGQNTGVDSLSFLQRIFPTQGNKTKKTPNQHKFRTKWLQSAFYQTFREELTLSFLNNSKKIAVVGTLTHSFYQANITLIPKKERKITHKKKITCQYIWWTWIQKSITKYLQMKFNNTVKELYTMIKWDSSQGCKDGSISTYQTN